MPSLSSMQASVSDPWSGLNPDDLRDVFRRPGVSWWISRLGDRALRPRLFSGAW